MADYTDYQHAMAQHAAHTLASNNQLHPAMAQIPMSQMLSAGLNLTVSSPNQVQVMSGQLTNSISHAGQHHLATPTGHHVMYQNVQQSGGGGGGGGHHGSQSHKKQKKPKVNKDGVPAPKRATTAYINFTQWYREELKKSGRPIPKIGDFGKECAGKWNTMAEEEKKPFLETAARDRDRYKREMAVFKPARDANKPKRPGTAFMLFMADFRKEMAGKEPEGGVAALAKLGGERWRNMTEEDKRPYVERQNEEKIRYEASMEEYRRKSAPGAIAGGPSPKQARLSTEGSENDESDSGGGHNANDQLIQPRNEISGQHQQQQQNMMKQQSVSTPSPASSSPPTQLTMTPSPGAAGQQQQQQQGQAQGNQQSIQQNSSANNMTTLPSMSLSHPLTATQASAFMAAGYSQHSFANFGHPGTTGVLTSTTTGSNYNQSHSGNMAQGTSPYLPTGSGTYPAQLGGHGYSWN